MLDKNGIARRIAQELRDGWYVNLGIGIPELVARFVPEGRTFIYHTENGLLGMGPSPEEGAGDPELINAGKRHVTANVQLDGEPQVLQPAGRADERPQPMQHELELQEQQELERRQMRERRMLPAQQQTERGAEQGGAAEPLQTQPKLRPLGAKQQ